MTTKPHASAADQLTRRGFIGAGATLALGGLAASCGGSGSSGSSSGPDTAAPLKGTTGDIQVVKRFPPDVLVPGEVRLPVSLADTSGVLGAGGNVQLPQRLTAQVVNAESGATVATDLTAPIHGANLSVPYWPFMLQVDDPGLYLLRIDQAPKADAAFQVMKPGYVQVPLVGNSLPPFDTPTVSNPRGVDPICTRPAGTCPFHTATLTEALASGKPVAYLIGTPAYCTTGTCAPALDSLMEVAAKVGDSMMFVHSDVYTDKSTSTVAPAVRAYKLSYEPVLFVTDSTGTLTQRLDVVFDTAELLDVLNVS